MKERLEAKRGKKGEVSTMTILTVGVEVERLPEIKAQIQCNRNQKNIVGREIIVGIKIMDC